MKQIIQILCIALLMVACINKKTNDYVKISGTILNPTSDSIALEGISFGRRVFNLDKDGRFIIDSLKIKENQVFYISHGEKYFSVYLENGYDIELEWALTEDVNHTGTALAFIGEGPGLKENNYLRKSQHIQSETIDKIRESMDLDSTSFKNLLEVSIKKLIGFLESQKELDTSFVNYQKNRYLVYKKSYLRSYNNLNNIKMLNSNKAPEFEFENHAGGATSLSDLRGKYVYLDVWATWCGPCLKEIPYLKELEKKYHNKNIYFVSISVDKKEDYETWKYMVTDLELSGLQLYTNEDVKFIEDYSIMGIPRFILINPEGKIILAKAPRPSDKNLKNIFENTGV